MVFNDPHAIYCIARSILHHSLRQVLFLILFFLFFFCEVARNLSCCRTKALVLELLAAICLVKGGHELIVDAFDRFRTVHHYL